jgi:hypothetical protein
LFIDSNTMNYLCSYSNMFDDPNKGIHQYKIFGIAIIDLLVTIIFALMIAKYYKISFIKTLLTLFLLSILFHRLFCVKTAVDVFLF